jgi:hypothetical protein
MPNIVKHTQVQYITRTGKNKNPRFSSLLRTQALELEVSFNPQGLVLLVV